MKIHRVRHHLRRKAFVGLTIFNAFFSLAGALTVRVDPAGGAPRILVNGEPVRARMFWGSPGAATIRASSAPQQINFDFTATESAENGTMHFRFGAQPGEIFLDDVHVTDLDATNELVPRCDFENGMQSFNRDWKFWPPGNANTVGSINVSTNAGRDGSSALHVTLKAPPDGQWPDFHIYHHPDLRITAGHRYHVACWLRAEPARSVKVAFYRPGNPFVFLGGPPDAFESEIKLAASAGVNFVSFPIDLPWPKPGEPAEWHNADAACQRVLTANPDALLVPRIPMDPPVWWCEAHPGDVMQWENGQRDHAVPASPQYRHDAAEQLVALIDHLETKLGNHIAGYHPAGQNTGEWFYENSWQSPLNGYAPADLTAWRAWLKARYATDAGLCHAWNVTNIALDSVAVPTAAERHASPAGTFRDPQKEQPLIDWAEFQQQAMADCVCELAHAARTASCDRKLILFFYGYVFELAGLHHGPSVSGHYALRRVLNSSEIDVLCSPISYFDRGLGGNAPSMTATESVALAGKLWLNEDDTHTYLATEQPPGWQDHVNTIEDTDSELTRNVAQESLRNIGTWWMDLCASGWFNDPKMWEQMARLKALDEAMLKSPAPFRPEVAAVIDERVMLRTSAAAARVTWPGIYEARRALGRMGAPFGQYLLDDVLAGRVHAKLYVFLNAWRLTAAERETLSRVTHGAARLWCYTPGYFDGDRISPAAMRQLTGFDLQPVAAEKFQPPHESLAAIRPLFCAADATPAETISKYPDGSASVAMRRAPDGISVFIGTPGLTSEWLRDVAREAKVHLFTQTDCNVYANGRFVALHAAQDGATKLDVGRTGKITDIMTGQIIGQGPQIVLPMKRGETQIIRF